MQAPRPSHGNIPLPNMPNVRVGTQATAESFGANHIRQNQELAGAVGGLGNAVFAEAEKRQRREDETLLLKSINQAHMQYAEESKALFDQYKGEDAINVTDAVEKKLQSMRGDIEKTLHTKNQHHAFARTWEAFALQAQKGALKYRDQEMEFARVTQLNASSELVDEKANEVVVGPGGIEAVLGNPEIGSSYLQIILNNTDKLTEGMPEEARELNRRKASRNFHASKINALVATDPDKALAYLSDDRVKGDYGKADYARIRGAVFKAIEVDAKKHMENEARDLGIQLGETCNSDIDIERALYEYDREIADKALPQAKRILAARKSAEKDHQDDDQSRLVREAAADIALAARDEQDIQDATDSLDGITEEFRERVFKAAVSRKNIRQTRESRELAETTNEAMQSMADAGWDPAAVSSDWSPELQVKMGDIAEKMQKRTARADPVRALEYCDMTPGELRNRVRAGEWADMTVTLGGVNSPEYKLVWKKAFEAGGDSGTKELMTPTAYGRSEFLRITKTDPSNKFGKHSYSEFLHHYLSMLSDRAKDLELDDVGKIPRAEQDAVITYLLQNGKYDEGFWYWGRSRRRYQVMNDPNMDMQYFTPATSSSGSGQIKIVPERDVPDFARGSIGLRDKERRLLPNGNFLVVNQDGRKIITRPDGTRLQADPVAFPPVEQDTYDTSWNEVHGYLGIDERSWGQMHGSPGGDEQAWNDMYRNH